MDFLESLIRFNFPLLIGKFKKCPVDSCNCKKHVLSLFSIKRACKFMCVCLISDCIIVSFAEYGLNAGHIHGNIGSRPL